MTTSPGTLAIVPNESVPLISSEEGVLPFSTRKLVLRPLNVCFSLIAEVSLGYNLYNAAIKDIKNADTLNKVIAGAQPVITTLFKDKFSYDLFRIKMKTKHIGFLKASGVILGNAIVTGATYSVGILIAYLVDKNS